MREGGNRGHDHRPSARLSHGESRPEPQPEQQTNERERKISGDRLEEVVHAIDVTSESIDRRKELVIHLVVFPSESTRSGGVNLNTGAPRSDVSKATLRRG